MKRRITLVFTLVLALGMIAGPAYAKKDNLPKITGGGWAENNNTGDPDFPLQNTQFGFNARATGPGVVQTGLPFPQGSTVYPAAGQFQVKNSAADGTKLSQGHGEVVCIANYGPSSGADGGGNPAGDVWEIRVGFEAPDGSTVYGSFYVQDNGKTDYMDENFRFIRLLDPRCGIETQFGLEPVTKGNIKVH